MSFTMPKDLVCTFDPMCMGVECCINVKLFMFLHKVKAYARFDPCQMEFHYGIDDWHGSIAFPKLDFDGKCTNKMNSKKNTTMSEQFQNLTE